MKKMALELSTPGERLRAVRAFCASSRIKFCAGSKLSESTLKAWENDVALLTVKGAKLMCNIFQDLGVYCTPEWLLHHKGNSPLRSAEDLTPSALSEEKFIESEFDRVNNYYQQEAVLHRVKDQLMAPLFKVGDFVGGVPLDVTDVPYYWGESVLVRLANGLFVLRKIEKGSEPGVIRLSSLTESAEDVCEEDVDKVVVYHVVWHRSPVHFRAKKPSERNLRRAIG